MSQLASWQRAFLRTEQPLGFEPASRLWLHSNARKPRGERSKSFLGQDLFERRASQLKSVPCIQQHHIISGHEKRILVTINNMSNITAQDATASGETTTAENAANDGNAFQTLSTTGDGDASQTLMPTRDSNASQPPSNADVTADDSLTRAADDPLTDRWFPIDTGHRIFPVLDLSVARDLAIIGRLLLKSKPPDLLRLTLVNQRIATINMYGSMMWGVSVWKQCFGRVMYPDLKGNLAEAEAYERLERVLVQISAMNPDHAHILGECSGAGVWRARLRKLRPGDGDVATEG